MHSCNCSNVKDRSNFLVTSTFCLQLHRPRREQLWQWWLAKPYPSQQVGIWNTRSRRESLACRNRISLISRLSYCLLATKVTRMAFYSHISTLKNLLYHYQRLRNDGCSGCPLAKYLQIPCYLSLYYSTAYHSIMLI